MIRVGERGEGRFERVSWVEALNEAVKRLKEIREKYGAEALTTFKYSGSREYLADAVARRFLNLYGATMLEGSQCVGSLVAAEVATFGPLTIQAQYPEIWSEHTECIVIWGWDPEGRCIHIIPFINRALERGAKLIVVTTEKTRLATKADIHLQPRPGTDAALALGMMKHITEKGMHDKDFTTRYTYGFDKLLKSLEDWSVERASKITDVPKEEIIRAAEMYASNKSMIELGFAAQRHTNGHQAHRAMACLAAICGKIGKPGEHFNSGNTVAAIAFKDGVERISFPEGAPIRKDRRQIVITLTNEGILAAKDPPIKGLICWRGGFISQHANVSKTLEAIRKLDTFIVFELFQTDDVDYADVVFPACSGFEQWGIHPSYRENHYVQAEIPVVEPYYECRPDIDIWSELGRALGFEQYFPKDMTGEDWLRMILPENIKLEKIMHPNGPFAIPKELWPEVPNSDYKFTTPSGKIELYSLLWEEQQTIKKGEYSPLPIYVEPEESPISKPELFERYPLVLTSTRGPYRIHSQFLNLPWIQEIEGEPFIQIHPYDAKTRRVKDGDKVIVKNDRGRIEVTAKVTLRMKKGVVNIWDGWWLKTGGCPNVLTENYFGGPRKDGDGLFRDFNMGLDGGTACYYDCLVEVELANEPPA